MNSTWTALRLWINEKETAELLGSGSPAPLTAAQRQAINTLIPGAVPVAPGLTLGQGHVPARAAPPLAPVTPPAYTSTPSGPVIDPKFEREDWVSKLTCFTQTSNHPPPEFTYTEHEPGPKMPKKWAGLCTVSHIAESFPNSDYGFLGGEAPWFSNKKDAKQYASKCAMLCTEDAISRPRQNTPPPTTPATPAPSTSRQTTQSKGKSKEYEDDDDSNGVSLAPQSRDEPEPGKQVTLLCKTLGLTAPSFSATAHERPNYYNARPVFPESFTEYVPEGLGVVSGILTQTEAKEAAARLVLDWLKEIERKRNSDFMGLCGPGSAPL